MKKVLVGLVIAAAAASAQAMTFWQGGLLMGTVCRYGLYFTAYPVHMAQPVGTSCPVRDNFGNIVGFGVVTSE